MTLTADSPPRTPRASRAHQRTAPAASTMAERLGWSIACLLSITMGAQVWTASLDVNGANYVAMFALLLGLVGIWLVWVRQSVTVGLQLALLGSLALSIAFFALGTWSFNPGYGTDAVAFDQYAAQLVLHGSNPYVHSTLPALELFRVPESYHTFRLDGSTVANVSYPAGSFLLYVPFLALGFHTQIANVVDLLFWFVAMVILWALLPSTLRWVAALVLAGWTYVGFAIGGLTDTLYMPFLLLALWRWDRYGYSRERSAARWIGPVALGLAISIKQTPAFVLPFLLIGVAFETAGRGRSWAGPTARYLFTTVAVALIPNVPFIIASPLAWTRAFFTPFDAKLIPDGEGLVDLVLFDRIGGGDLKMFTVADALFLLAVLVAFVVRYDLLKRSWLPLIAISFFLPVRSFTSYSLMFLPAVFLGAVSVEGAPFTSVVPRLSRHFVPIVAGAGALALVPTAVALASPSPMAISIVGSRSTGELETIDEVTVKVTNRTATVEHPHFTLNDSGHATTFWYPMGPTGDFNPVIGPHQTVVLTLHAPNVASEPSVAAPFVVEAFSVSPATVSVSGAYLVSPLSTEIVPEGVNTPVPLGRAVALTVQVQNRYGEPLAKAGIPVALGQVVYGENALISGESSINGRPEGQTPVVVYTDSSGRARFHVVGVQVQSAPVYYQAWIAYPGSAPHSYSNQILVQFRARS